MILHNFYIGQAFDAYTYFGVHKTDGGFVFRTYAPRANKVAVFGEFNGWQEAEMVQIGLSGIYQITIKEANYNQMYKYVIYGENGRVEHSDPYGFGMELRPNSASIIRDLDEYTFTDDEWMNSACRREDMPLNIYEMHLGSWKGEGFPKYNEIALELIPYLKENHYNFVEFMPLSEHPFDGSWGYQNTGFYAPTSRYGSAAELMELVDQLHNAGIGAIMDFVPVHFAVDYYGLKQYDGSFLYEYPHKDVGESEWGSYNFIHSRGEVASFLQSAANYWLTEYHFDGLRYDAVSRLIYWQGDEKRGINDTALSFLRNMNKGLHHLHPRAILIAEDSTSYEGTTKPVYKGGLGFNYKWDLGWMNDTLDYLKHSPMEREKLRSKIEFSMFYFYNEDYLLPLSHDEVVHGKKTIVDKINGSYEEKFSTTRLLYMYMMTHPGKKLNFMGNEIAMFREWDEKREMDWDLLKMPMHDAFHNYMIALNEIYLENSSLSEFDYAHNYFQWIDANKNPCLFAYRRSSRYENMYVILNFSDKKLACTLPITHMEVLLDSNLQKYGGTSKRTHVIGDNVLVPPLTGMIIKEAK